MSGGESEMWNMAGEDSNKKNCFTRCPGVCSCLLGVVLVIAVAVCVAAPLLNIYTIQPAVSEEIDENVVLTKGSVGTSQFTSSSAPLYSSYSMFTVLNAPDVEKGAKPQLKEIGPFVYRENRTKVNLTWEGEDGGEGDEVLKYSLLINYTFDEARSAAHDPKTTMVTTINVPLIGVLQKMLGLLSTTSHKKALTELLKLIDEAIKHAIPGEGLFVTKSVHDLLWGYNDNLLKDLKTLQDMYNDIPFHKKIDIIDSTEFGFGTLSSVETPNRVYTGSDNVTRVGVFKQWNGNYNMSSWGSKYAQMINGTGGFLFHPGVTRDKNLVAFIDELYRSGYFSYQEDVSVSGIALYKFGLPKEELVNTSQDPGFYANGPSGVLNLTAVVPSNVPLFASKPHFLDADPRYRANVTGLHPNRTQHDSYLAVEPITGAVLDAAKRIQVNLRLAQSSAIPQLSSVRNITMLPIYWAAQSGTITPDLAAKFRATVYGVEEGISGAVWGVVGIAGLVAVVCLLCLIGVGVGQCKRGKSGRGTNTRRRQLQADDEISPLLSHPHTNI